MTAEHTAAQDELFPGYRKGYLKALLDFREYLESHDESLAYNKIITKQSNRDIRRLLTAMLDDLDECIRYGSHIEVMQMADGKTFVT